MTSAPAFSDSACTPAPEYDAEYDAGYGFTDTVEAATQSAQGLAAVLAGGPDADQAWGHTGSSVDCPGCAFRCEAPGSHNWGCGCAPHGPGAARQVAEYLASHDLHAHLVVDGHDTCMSGDCEQAVATLAGTLL